MMGLTSTGSHMTAQTNHLPLISDSSAFASADAIPDSHIAPQPQPDATKVDKYIRNIWETSHNYCRDLNSDISIREHKSKQMKVAMFSASRATHGQETAESR